MTVDQIFAKFATNTKLGEGIGLSPVRSSEMRKRGVIPPRYWKALLAHAEKLGVKLTAADLIDAHTPPKFGAD